MNWISVQDILHKGEERVKHRVILLEIQLLNMFQARPCKRRCKNRHPSPICTRFEHHFHALKPHLHCLSFKLPRSRSARPYMFKFGRCAIPARSFSDTLPENRRHLTALKRHPCGTYKSSASQAGQQSLIQFSSGIGIAFSVKMFSNIRIRSRCCWSSFSAA